MSNKIPRHLGFADNFEVQLHVFVDASKKVFSITVYARILEVPEPEDLNKSSVSARGIMITQLQLTKITAIARETPT
jgi:hypothetical protein